MNMSSLQPDLAHRYRLIGAILAELRPGLARSAACACSISGRVPSHWWRR